MTEYVQEKVIEALKKAKGMRGTAKRMLAGLCATDERFLREVVSNHLGAILDHAIQHYARTTLAQMSQKPVAAAPPKAESMGKEMLKRFAGQNTPQFGLDDPSQGTGKRPAASKRHKDAINLIAKRVETTK